MKIGVYFEIFCYYLPPFPALQHLEADLNTLEKESLPNHDQTRVYFSSCYIALQETCRIQMLLWRYAIRFSFLNYSTKANRTVSLFTE